MEAQVFHTSVTLPRYHSIMNYADKWHSSHSENFLEKIMAGCAIIAFGDGHVSPAERQHMLALIHRFEPLKCYDIEHIDFVFDRACIDFEHDPIFAEDEALADLASLRSDQETADRLVKICCAIASIDGDFSKAEQRVARRMCLTLGLDPANYQLP
jgi:tellurite resistance protein TerB